MKTSFRIILIASLVCLASAAQAQNVRIIKAGDITDPDGSRRYAMPSTTVIVDITVKKEVVRKGPYARFAQRYFGTIAPLADKELYTITAASLGWHDNETAPEPNIMPVEAPLAPVAVTTAEWEFPKVQADLTSMANRTEEDAARKAAQTVFDIRKRRAELISGDYSETIFGEGLRAAIERMDQTEKEYLELFYGKQSVAYETMRYYIIPSAEKTTYTVCRWNEGKGLLPESDLTGQPIILDMKPQGVAPVVAREMTSPDRKKAKASTGERYVIADNVVCRVLEGKRELASRTIPVLQYGAGITE